MNLFKYLFESNKDVQLSKASVRKLARKAGIIYLKNDLYDVINSKYNNHISDHLNQLKKITDHRKGKIIRSKDLKLLLDLKNTSQHGGNYDGFCDNNIGQCSDSIMCGGKLKYTDLIVPKERFIRILKSNNKNIKVSKNLSNNLQKIVEKKMNIDLINAKSIAQKNSRKMINLGDLLINL